MKFWGVEVKKGEPLLVESGNDGFILHISQACLGEVKKGNGNENVVLYVTFGGKKLVLGRLSADKCPQISFDLIFEQDFELSHNCANGSVYFGGYKIPYSEGGDSSESDSEMGEDLPVAAGINNEFVGKPELQSKQGKPIAEKASVSKPDYKQKVKIVEPSKDAKPDEETDSTDDDDGLSLDEDDESSDDQVANGEDDESDDNDEESNDSSEEDESDEEDEETPEKVELGHKRSAESPRKTPVPDKKAKLITPQKTDGKKVDGHVATPYPSKHVAKAPANSDQKKEQTQKSFSCKSCNRSFGSENALQSHTKAKHSAA